MSDGILKVATTIGEGTSFHVLIPLVKYSQNRKKLLIVDDDVSISELLAQYFSSKELEVSTAKNGRVAMDSLNKINPDLILSDIEMPALVGLELVNEVKKINSDQKISQNH